MKPANRKYIQKVVVWTIMFGLSMYNYKAAFTFLGAILLWDLCIVEICQCVGWYPFKRIIKRYAYWVSVEPTLISITEKSNPLIAYPILMRLNFEREILLEKFIELPEKQFKAWLAEYLTKPRELSEEELEIEMLKKECDEVEQTIRQEQFKEMLRKNKEWAVKNRHRYVPKASNKKREGAWWETEEQVRQRKEDQRRSVMHSLEHFGTPYGKQVLEKMKEEDDLNNTLKGAGISRPE